MRGEQRPEAEIYHLRLLREMRDCDHPPAFRREPRWMANAPLKVRADPSEWECEVCGTIQTRALES